MSLSGILPEKPSVLFIDFIAEIRRRQFLSGEDISSIARSLKFSHITVRKQLLTTEESVYPRTIKTFPKLGEFQDRLEQLLELDSRLPKNNAELKSAFLSAYFGVPMTACRAM